MFAYISHEFRTPLTLISGPITDLKHKTKDEEDLQLLNIAQRNTERMSSLVNQLLDLSQAYQLEKQAKTPQNISEIANQLSASFQSIAINKHIQFNITITPDLYAEAIERSIESILTNLLANAFKYTNDDGEITLTVSAENQFINLIVKDNGIGIPKNNIDSVFEQFTRLEDINRNKVEGAGLGLALVKQLIDIHNWQITVNSEVNKGSEFTVTIPVMDVVVNTKQNISAEAINQINYLGHSLTENTAIHQAIEITIPELSRENKTKLLVIDDTEDMILYLQGLLSSEFNCSYAYNGESGLELAQKESPDLIICDVMMPGISGFDILDQLRSKLETSHIPVLLLTAKSDKESRIKGLIKLADDYITKPFDGDELKARVNATLALRKLRQDRVLNQVLNKDSVKETVITLELSPRDRIFIDK